MGEAATVHWHVLEDTAALRAIEPAWRALLDRAVFSRPMSEPMWLSTWWRVFGTEGARDLRVLAVMAGGELVGLVPLLRRVVRQGVFRPLLLELLGSGEPPGDDIRSEPIGAIAARGAENDVARAFAAAVSSGAIGRWDELRLSGMSSDDPMVPLLGEALRDVGIQPEIQITGAHPFIDLPSSWEGYLAQLGGSRRAYVRRTLRDLTIWAGPGGLVLRSAGSLSELEEGWRILRVLHEERRAAGGTFRSDRFARFHGLVLPRLLRGDGGELELLWLEVRGAPVAAQCNILHRGEVFAYLSGRSLAAPAQVRPGIAMHLFAIRRAIERGDRVYDLLSPDAPYKRLLAPSRERHLVTLSAAAPSPRARALRAVRLAVRRLGGRA